MGKSKFCVTIKTQLKGNVIYILRLVVYIRTCVPFYRIARAELEGGEGGRPGVLVFARFVSMVGAMDEPPSSVIRVRTYF